MNRKQLLPLLLIAPLAMAQQAREDTVFAPGVQHVCVPAADGEDWDCGTVDAPPENYQAPAAETAPDVPASASSVDAATDITAQPADEFAEDTPPPPPFLADPMRDTPYAPIDAPSSEPATAAEAVIAAEAAAERAPAQEDVPEPEVAPEPPVVHVPQQGLNGSVGDHAGRADIVAAPTAEAVATPVPVTHDAPLGIAADFARLPATAFTLQLAYAATPADFPRLVAALGLDPATCYALRIRGANGPVWLLAHGAYADAHAAKAAQAQLPKVDGLVAQWPRRIGALQTDITQGQ